MTAVPNAHANAASEVVREYGDRAALNGMDIDPCASSYETAASDRPGPALHVPERRLLGLACAEAMGSGGRGYGEHQRNRKRNKKRSHLINPPK
jgi:hypothetical protein